MKNRDTVNRVLATLAGASSLCWDPKPTGILDTEQAKRLNGWQRKIPAASLLFLSRFIQKRLWSLCRDLTLPMMAMKFHFNKHLEAYESRGKV